MTLLKTLALTCGLLSSPGFNAVTYEEGGCYITPSDFAVRDEAQQGAVLHRAVWWASQTQQCLTGDWCEFQGACTVDGVWTTLWTCDVPNLLPGEVIFVVWE